MIGYILFGLVVTLVAVGAWGEHFHGRTWRQGLDRMLGRHRMIMGGGEDLGIRTGDTVELQSDPCGLCGHERSRHHLSRSHKFQSWEMRCLALLGPDDPCRCRRFCKFRRTRVGELLSALYVPFWFK